MKRSRARVYRGTARNLAFLAKRLRAGEIVAVPTETVYGLAANALDPKACAKIFRAKRRPHHDPLIVHIHSFAELDSLCELNAAARRLMRRFWPGPLTIILPKKASVPDLVTAGRPSVAVRMPSHPLFRRLLFLTGLPLAAPSANPFGYISPTSAEHVRTSLGPRIQYILDGGESRIGLESTIIDLRNPQRPQLLRPGEISKGQLESALKCRVRKPPGHAAVDAPQVAPGMLRRHYSPRTPVLLHRALTPKEEDDQAYVFIAKPAGKVAGNVFWLDPRGSLSGVARRLFATLRKLDSMKFAVINIELAGGEGIAAAINDRLSRAAAR